MRKTLVGTALLLLVGCGTLRDDLNLAEKTYDAARYDDTMIWLSAIEDDVQELEGVDRARFYYLRGMAALRLEKRTEALHYLSLAREEAVEAEGGLRDSWAETLGPTLEELTPRGASHAAAPAPD